MKRSWKYTTGRADVSGDIAHVLAEILESAKHAVEIVGSYSYAVPEKPDISRYLLIMFHNSDDLLELAKPSLDAAELHGLPKSALPERAKLVARHVDRDGWDFIPWFYEKIGNVKKCTKSAIDWWELTPSDVTNDNITDKAGFLKEEMLASLQTAMNYAQLVFEQVCNFKLELETKG